MPALRADKTVVLGAHQGMPRLEAAHGEHPKQLLRKGRLIDPGEVGQSKASPAQAQGAGALGAGNPHQLDHFLPVGDLLIGQMLHRSAGDDQAIKGR